MASTMTWPRTTAGFMVRINLINMTEWLAIWFAAGSSYIPKEYQSHLKCIVDQEVMVLSRRRVVISLTFGRELTAVMRPPTPRTTSGSPSCSASRPRSSTSPTGSGQLSREDSSQASGQKVRQWRILELYYSLSPVQARPQSWSVMTLNTTTGWYRSRWGVGEDGGTLTSTVLSLGCREVCQVFQSRLPPQLLVLRILCLM